MAQFAMPNCRETSAPGRSNSASFDHLRRTAQALIFEFESHHPSHAVQSLWGNSGACTAQPFKQKEPRSRVRPMASCRLAIIWTVRARRAKVFPPSPDRPAEACCEVSSPRAPVVLGVAFLGQGVSQNTW